MRNQDGVVRVHRIITLRATKVCAAHSHTKCQTVVQKHSHSAYVQGLDYPRINTNKLTTTTSWYTAGTPPRMTWTLCASGTPSACAVEGSAVKVVVNYPFTFNVPFLKPMVINMSNSSMMVISQ